MRGLVTDPRDIDAVEWEPPARDEFNELDVQEMQNGKLKVTNMIEEVVVSPDAMVETSDYL